ATRHIRYLRKTDAYPSRSIRPHYEASSVNITLCFRKVEAQVKGAVHFQRGRSLNGGSAFADVDDLAQVQHHAARWPTEAGISRTVDSLAWTPAAFEREMCRITSGNRRVGFQGLHGGKSPYILRRVVLDVSIVSW